MEIFEIDTTSRSQVRDFLSVPWRIYQANAQWVPPLAGEERLRLDRQRYPFFRHSQAAFFIVMDQEAPLGRLAVIDNHPHNEYNHEKTAFFYLFECVHDFKAANLLFEAAFLWARQRGLTSITGPRGFTALDGLGLLVEGFHLRPALGQPYNLQYYPDLIERIGFVKTSDVVSGYLDTDMDFPERIHELAVRIRERRGLHIAYFRNRGELRNALSHLQDLYNGSLGGTSGGTPISSEEIKVLADQILWFADPGLIKIVMKDDRPVGFLLAYPDISAALQRSKGKLFPFGWFWLLKELRTTDRININGAGMLPEYRGLGGTAILYSEMFKSVIDNPRYRHAEIIQIGQENEQMQREMTNFGVEFNKIHRTYSRDL